MEYNKFFYDNYSEISKKEKNIIRNDTLEIFRDKFWKEYQDIKMLIKIDKIIEKIKESDYGIYKIYRL